MEKEILKYLEQGISIDGNPKDGYTVFTIKTQHFKISSLDELSVERFEEAIAYLNSRYEYLRQLYQEDYQEYYQNILNIYSKCFQDYIDGKYR